MSSISISDLSVSYGSGIQVIDHLDLEIAEGSFFTLLGPSGCGKTTLLRVIAGFVQPSAGRLCFGAIDMTRLPAHQRGIGMVFQDYALFPDKTVFDNVAYGLRARKTDPTTIQRKVGEYLERVGMQGFEDRYPPALSGGQRQRVALARALVIEPRVLLMDEPLSNLDSKLRLQIRTAIADLQRDIGITTVFVTHDQEEALALSDQIALMRQGRIAQLGSPQEIYQRPASTYVADFIGAANLLQGEILDGSTEAGGLTIRVAGQALQALAQALPPDGLGCLIARPENIQLLTADGPLGNSLPGQVRRKQYLGHKTTYNIELADQQQLAVDCFGPARREFAEGQTVRLQFDPQTSQVVPR
ncbi:ABC transporter ATP-binding protein [Pseudomonas sp. Fl4BN1]|uniref:ABC transporter ATP-binding protein n=1 Tax=Pseudomonas sp. Fl4BN1 TaxID=2697651 RepID=UPI0013776F87|nr:ABC transporter ATP-binding protein [Pseudomonas sp. Fl4BN1]NBF10018.1 ATP-binding cassette domain-containing protein [Pseudomonas sp. Fl4BN1]